jgi:hypothetical protein
MSILHFARRASRKNMPEKQKRMLLCAVGLAALAAAPAEAKSHTQQHHAAPAVAHQSTTITQADQLFGADPDPRVRFELRRDGSSSWEEPAVE